MASETPLRELQSILARHDHEIDEPEAIHFIAEVRARGIINDREWREVLEWVDRAMTWLEEERARDKRGPIDIDADPRNADWTKIVRAERLAGHRMPDWAALWLWSIGYDREGGEFWERIGSVAKAMGFPPLEEPR